MPRWYENEKSAYFFCFAKSSEQTLHELCGNERVQSMGSIHWYGIFASQVGYFYANLVQLLDDDVGVASFFRRTFPVGFDDGFGDFGKVRREHVCSKAIDVETDECDGVNDFLEELIACFSRHHRFECWTDFACKMSNISQNFRCKKTSIYVLRGWITFRPSQKAQLVPCILRREERLRDEWVVVLLLLLCGRTRMNSNNKLFEQFSYPLKNLLWDQRRLTNERKVFHKRLCKIYRTRRNKMERCYFCIFVFIENR